MLLKPRFGIRMWSGIWPPSKPKTETPERLFWPFWPRPAVLPRPEPMPRPTRTLDLRAPLLSRMSFSLISALAFAFVAPLLFPSGERPGEGEFDATHRLPLSLLTSFAFLSPEGERDHSSTDTI